ncbi:MAG TPA: hypothetical protein VND95_15500 [Stellaceae bacterium]|nr:hypothetical protein [Stellaceae bacterium]
MRRVLLVGSLLLAACSATPRDTAELTLHDPYWDRVNVEVVITKRADCDSRGNGYISTQKLVMAKNVNATIDAPHGANVCWRHDRDPNNPAPGAWSGWTRATLFPGQSADTDL